MEDRESEKVRDKKEGKVFKSFLLEFTAPRFFNEVVRRIIERRLCDGVSRVTNFKHIKFAERKRLIASRGFIADDSVGYLDGLNLDSLRRTFQHEIRRVVKVEEEIPFQMRNTQSARKLIMKLQKFRFLEEKLKEKPNNKGIVYSGLDKYKDIEGDKKTVKLLLEELKKDLESSKSRCNPDIRSKLKDVIEDVCSGIEYFSRIEHLGRKQRKLDTLKYLSMIFICYGVYLVEK